MSVEKLFESPLKVVNVGLQSFARDLESAGVDCRQVTIAAEAPGSDAASSSVDTGEE